VADKFLIFATTIIVAGFVAGASFAPRCTVDANGNRIGGVIELQGCFDHSHKPPSDGVQGWITSHSN
jgi:hypothetical protein